MARALIDPANTATNNPKTGDHSVTLLEAGFGRLRLENGVVPGPLRELTANIYDALISSWGYGYSEFILLSV